MEKHQGAWLVVQSTGSSNKADNRSAEDIEQSATGLQMMMGISLELR